MENLFFCGVKVVIFPDWLVLPDWLATIILVFNKEKISLLLTVNRLKAVNLGLT